MNKKTKHYSVSLSRELQTRIRKLFEDFPEVELEYKKGNNPGYVRFIEEAIRKLIDEREKHAIRKRTIPDYDLVMMEELGIDIEKSKKELEEELLRQALLNRSSKLKKKDS